MIRSWPSGYSFRCSISCKRPFALTPLWVPYMLRRITRQNHSVKALAAVWPLPSVAPTVPSMTDALFARAILLQSTNHAMITLFMSIVLLFLDVSLTLMVLPLYRLRLITEGFPESTFITSKFLPVGPCGQVRPPICLVRIFQASKLIVLQGVTVFIIIGKVFADMAKRGTNDNIHLSESYPSVLLGVRCAIFLRTFGIPWILLSAVGIYETFRWSLPDFAVEFGGMVFQ